MTETTYERTAALRDLRRIPGVGVRIAEDLHDLGYRRVGDLRDEDPEAIYQRMMDRTGTHIDRCMLYVLRCAVYFARETEHDPERLKWWNWKDGRS